MNAITSWPRLAVLGGAMAAALTVFAPTMAQAQTVTDPFAGYCPANAPITLFLIDQTEAYDDIDRRRLAEGAISVMNQLRAGERLEIYTLTNQPGALTPAASLCIPGCPDEYNTRSPIWEQRCARVVIERDKRGFQSFYGNLIRGYLFSAQAADGTELLRTLSRLSVEFEGRPVRKVVLFSDMIEFSDLSRRVNMFSAEDARTLLGRVETRAPLRGTFQGVEIEAFGFGKRLGQLDKGEAAELSFDAAEAIRGFWERYFTKVMGAGAVRITLNHGP